MITTPAENQNVSSSAVGHSGAQRWVTLEKRQRELEIEPSCADATGSERGNVGLGSRRLSAESAILLLTFPHFGTKFLCDSRAQSIPDLCNDLPSSAFDPRLYPRHRPVSPFLPKGYSNIRVTSVGS
jgi:hypothetical protein